jgi:hypothetical protein
VRHPLAGEPSVTREIEQAVVDAIPHEEVLIKTADRTYDLRECPGTPGQCICGAAGRQARMLAAIQMHVDKKTGGRVYLDRA